MYVLKVAKVNHDKVDMVLAVLAVPHQEIYEKHPTIWSNFVQSGGFFRSSALCLLLFYFVKKCFSSLFSAYSGYQNNNSGL
ncbi:MAG: hypothetical protein HRU06_03580 [Oceanospirillaceae bacterium]|nr:hypothetical protein [Oceanospirillaceae bacterium]